MIDRVDDTSNPCLHRKAILIAWIVIVAVTSFCCCLLMFGTSVSTPLFRNPEALPNTAVYVPAASDPQLRLPILLFLNGLGENGSDGLFQLSNNFGQDLWRRRGEVPFLVVCPQCSKSGGWTRESADGKAAMVILDGAIARYGGDPERVFVTGPSTGGAGAIELASAFPERFAGVVVVSSVASGDVAALSKAGMPVWSFFNVGDSEQMLKVARKTRLAWLKAGLSPLVSELPGTDHNAWDPAYASPAIYAWMLRQPKSLARDRGRFAMLTARDALQRSPRTQGWVADDEYVLSSVGNHSPLVLPSSSRSKLHFDVWLVEPSCVSVSLVSRAEVVLQLLIELPECGTGAVIEIGQPNDGPRIRPSATFAPETRENGHRGHVWPSGSVGTTAFRGVENDSAELVEKRLGKLRPEAQRTLVSGWNDVRLESAAGRVQVFLNGWLAADVADRCQSDDAWWKVMSEQSGPVKIRYVRQWLGTGSDAEVEKKLTTATDARSGAPGESNVPRSSASRIHEAEHRGTLECSWRILRDSRFSDFGGEDASDAFQGNCRIEEQSTTIEMPFRVRSRPSIGESFYNDDPGVARTEFREFLLENQLQGDQTPPVWKSRKIVARSNVRPTARGAGRLDETLLFAPLLVFRPDSVLTAESLVRSATVARCGPRTLAVWKSVGGSVTEEIWRDEARGNRVVRWIEQNENGVTRQIDIEHVGGDDECRILGWTALVLHPSGQVLDYATVVVDEASPTRSVGIPWSSVQ